MPRKPRNKPALGDLCFPRGSLKEIKAMVARAVAPGTRHNRRSWREDRQRHED